ncbi:amidase family protein [Gordonia shandongensis]|uniref:amidase family protein n=1 Tax=Gordonia shandongensis TaxID=376351 RepID=UPI0003F8ECBD|nr:amidase family protein [Gordonia shandongensis]
MDDIAYAGVVGASRMLDTGTVTARELVDRALERLARLDPGLGAFTQVFADRARAEADAADDARATGDRRPLLGIPIAVKGDTDIAGVVTGNGSRSYTREAPADAAIVARLREAGAIVIGTTALPEYAQWPFTASTALGVTRNPWDRDRTPGGSSGGSAAAVAAGIVPVATGGDGGGSIRIPAACCGLVGLKVGPGLVNTAPHGEMWNGLASLGVLTRTVQDAALVYDVLVGRRWTDTLASAAAGGDGGSLRIRVSASSALPGIRPDAELVGALDRVTGVLDDLGHRVDGEPVRLPNPTPGFLPRMAGGVRAELGAADHRRRAERRTRQLGAVGAVLGGPVLRGAHRYSRRVDRRVSRIFDDVDVLVTPTMAELPRRADGLGAAGVVRAGLRSMPSIAYTSIFNVTGHPAMSVPAGLSRDGLPLAVQLVAAHGGEPTLVALAAQLQERIDWTAQTPPVD